MTATRERYPPGACRFGTSPICDLCHYFTDWTSGSDAPGPDLVFYSLDYDTAPGGWCAVQNGPTSILGGCEGFRCSCRSTPRVAAPGGATREAAILLRALVSGPLAHLWHDEGKPVPQIPVDLWPPDKELVAANGSLTDERQAAVLTWARSVMVRDLDRLDRWQPKPERTMRRRA